MVVIVGFMGECQRIGRVMMSKPKQLYTNLKKVNREFAHAENNQRYIQGEICTGQHLGCFDAINDYYDKQGKIQAWVDSHDEKDYCKYCVYNDGCSNGVVCYGGAPIFPPCCSIDIVDLIDHEVLLEDLEQEATDGNT